MVALLPTLSDRDLRQLTPTLEELGLLSVPEIRARWEKAIESATDQRGLNIAKNVRDAGLKEKLAESADNAAKKAVAAATAEADIRVMFLVDKSGSMQGAIESSKDALGKMLAGFPLEQAARRGVRHDGPGPQAEGGIERWRSSTCSRRSRRTAARSTAPRCRLCTATACACRRTRS